MKELEIEKVVVAERFRTKFEGIEELAASISAHGLINPIVVDENNKLVAGERRLKAHQLLKLPTILARTINELTELEKREIELEENIQRKDFTWQEEVTAKKVLHELKQKIHGGAVKGHDSDGAWGVRETAQALGQSLGSVSMDIQLATGVRAFPELLKEKSKTTAYKKLKSLQTAVLQEELAKRLKGTGIIDVPNVILGDAVNEMSKMEAHSVDLLFTDPPYGIDIGSSKTFGRESGQKTYGDDDFETFDLLDKAIPQMYRVLKDDRHMIMFCGIDKFSLVCKMLEKHKFWVHKFPLIWDKGSGSYAGQKTSFTHSYECCIHAMKGKRPLNKDQRDVFPVKRVPPQRKIHPSEKPPEIIRELINILSLPGELILDPFAGSGVVGEAAKDMLRKSIMIEIDEQYHMNICKRLKGGDDSAE